MRFDLPTLIVAGLLAAAVPATAAVGRERPNGQDKHYLSDVLAGATLGYIVGRTVVRVNNRPLEAIRGASIQVTPILGRDLRGVRVTVVF